MSFGFGFGFPSWRTLAGGFSPAALFVGGVQGAWYDPSDLTTLFTTSAGTTPVSMPGQGAAVPVGLMLDKSQGLVLGPELVGNTGGPFTTTTGWVNTSLSLPATPSVVNGRLRITADVVGSGSDPRVYATITGLTIGKAYKVTYVGSSGTATNCSVAVTNTAPASNVTGGTGANVVGTDVAASFIRIAVATTEYVRVVVGGSTGTDGKYVELSSITVKELAGNHAIAFNNTTARPELRARVNLLTYSEEFDNGAWTKSGLNAFGSGSVANTTATLDPLGGNTADYIQENSANAPHYVFSNGGISVNATTYQGFVYAKAAQRSRLWVGIWNGTNYEICQFDLANGVILQEAVPGIASIQPAGNGWWKCGVSRNIGTVTTFLSFGPYINANISTLIGAASNASYTGDGTSGIYIWGADLRPANIGANVPAYQRIADANTYDTSNFPLYLRFDGIDDSMYTPANLNLSGTDKVSVFAGVRKLSDAAIGTITELSANASTTNGTFQLRGPATNGAQNYYATVSGTSVAEYLPATFAAPITNVVSSIMDIAGASISTELIPRVNGVVEQDSPSGTAGTGNFGTHPLFIGSRNNSAFWLNGHLYSLIIAGSAVSAGNISATEQWVAGKTGIQI